jgi:hypothetical protein
MNPIDWSFNLSELIIAIIIVLGSFVIVFSVFLFRRYLSPKTPSPKLKPIDTPSDTFKDKGSSKTNNKPDKRRMGNSINKFNYKVNNKEGG